MNKKISILGCGWLGLPLGKSFVDQNFVVNGSTTNFGKILTLENAGIKPHIVSISESRIIGHVNNLLSESSVLIIAIPPKLRGDAKENFVQKMRNLIPFIEKSVVERVVFISSTSVYSDYEILENETQFVDENTICEPKTESGKQLLAVEHMLMSNRNFQTTIIRFGGLIGVDRNPTNYLAGKSDVENPNAPVNFIHQKDCIGIINAVIEKNVWNTIFNGVAPNHKTRKNYYSQKAAELQLKTPIFNESKTSFGKIVSSEKAISILEYQFVEKI